MLSWEITSSQTHFVVGVARVKNTAIWSQRHNGQSNIGMENITSKISWPMKGAAKEAGGPRQIFWNGQARSCRSIKNIRAS